MRFKRQLETLIETYIAAREILVVTGMRRIGETALCRNIYNKLKTISKILMNLMSLR